MLCDICNKNEATVHLTEIVNGQVVEMHLCESCAQEKASQMQVPIGFQVFLGGIAPEKKSGGPGKTEDLVCPGCGLSYREFRKMGRLGCSQCYEAFKDYLVPLLKNIHGSSQHLGKHPKKVAESVQRRMRLVELRKELQKAIEAEAFEEAARLRDEIKALEAQEASGGEG